MKELTEALQNITTNKLEKNIDGIGVNKSLIRKGKLTWLPWVGENYTNSSKRTLIIGESHYYELKNSSFKEHQAITFTQKIVKNIAVLRKQNDKRSATMFENFYRSIQIPNQKREEYWNSVAFYNFIQQPMHSIKQRPSHEMITKAWITFESVIKILQPEVVIFIGFKACEGFNSFAEATFEDYSKIKRVITKPEMPKRQVPRVASVTVNDRVIPIHFIKHTSAFYSGKKWRKYFEENGMI